MSILAYKGAFNHIYSLYNSYYNIFIIHNSSRNHLLNLQPDQVF
jgi:hypothetical protein